MSVGSGIWECKIGECDVAKLPDGSDLPMREAVRQAYYDLTGEWPTFLFSGWGATLTGIERGVVAGRADDGSDPETMKAGENDAASGAIPRPGYALPDGGSNVREPQAATPPLTVTRDELRALVFECGGRLTDRVLASWLAERGEK